MTVEVSKQLVENIQEQINLFHTHWKVKINGLLWENMLHNALVKAGYKSSWDNGSHQKGVDIVCEDTRISCKGGQIEGKRSPRLKISSHRSTTYETFEEKMNFFCTDFEDETWSIVLLNENTYRVHVLSKPNLREFVWTQMKSGWKGVNNETGDKANISNKMSGQLWYDLLYDNILKDNKYYDFTIPQ